MELIFANDVYVFHGTFEERGIPKAAGFRWNPQTKVWWTDDPKKALRLIGTADMSPEVKTSLDSAVEAIAETASLSRAVDADMDIPAPEGQEYFGFQKAGIKFATSRANTLFGDEMGVGKTIQAIGVMNAMPEIKRVLIVCPASLRINWRTELNAWLTRPMEIGIAISNDLPDTDILVINFDILSRHVDALTSRHYDLLIVDEAHYVKNEKTKRYKAVKAIADSIKRKMFLTGTPIPNRPREGFAIFNLLAPSVFPKFFPYAMRYCAATKNRFGWDMDGASNLDELQNKLRESFMIRRLKKDVLTELPDKLRQIIALPENGLASVIKSENAKIKEWEAALEAAQSRLDALDGQEDTPEYADAVRALNSAVQAAFAEMSKLRHDTALAKAPYVAEHVKGLLEEVDKIVVMAHHHDVVDILMDALADYNPVRLTGRDSISNKDAAVQAFQNDPKTRVFVGSILAAGVGLTLTAASTVVFAEMDWVPGNMSQAEDRLHRIGQKDSVLVQHVVVDGSLDARMAQILVEKQAVLDAALDDPTVALDDSSLMAIILGAKKTAKKATAKKEADEKELSTMDRDEMEDVHLMVQMLAGLCDGAHTLDDVGFNRVDTQFGKQLGMAKSLSPRQTLAAKKMVRKYRRQLPEDLYARVFGATK